jgi:ATP synthase protein I
LAGGDKYGPRGFQGSRGFFSFGQSFISGVDSMVGTRGDGHGTDRDDDHPASDEAALSTRLTSLNQRLSKLTDSRKAQADRSAGENESGQAKASAMAIGIRLSSELVAGVLVGAVIGWGLDHWLSTSPWGLIVFLLLGFTAGVVNVMRSAGVMAKQSDRLH